MKQLTPEIYIEYLKKYGTHTAVAHILGKDPAYLRKWRRKYQSELADLEIMRCPGRPKKAEITDDGLLELLRGLPIGIEDLSEITGTGRSVLLQRIDQLVELGYNIVQTGDKYLFTTYVEPGDMKFDHRKGRNWIRFGLASDTHGGSKAQQLTHLNAFYDYCAFLGIEDIYHPGDMFDGVNVYPGQQSEIFLHTMDEQIDYMEDKYPYRPGIRTRVIGGNHDLAILKRGGSDPVKALANRRPDIDYLGPYSAWVTLTDNCVMHMVHPDGGGSYAVSYRVQKTIEGYRGGKKPHILALGHWHRQCYIMERNVHGLAIPSFQGQTNFLVRKGIQPQIGGVIVELEFSDDQSIHDMIYRYKTYLVEKENDR